MTTLRCHSRPVRLGPIGKILDHTYVTCPTNHCWPCWGDCLDGSILTTGEGSSARAAAIAGPDSEAGIKYGITGLCTQTANRIAWPASITVAQANGYGITEFLYGTYGPDPVEWVAHRDASKGVTGETPQCEGTAEPDENPSSDFWDALLSFLSGLYEKLARQGPSGAPTASNLDLLGGILEARVRALLGPDFPDAQIRSLQDIQGTLIDRKAPLDERVLAGDLSGREFAAQVNDLINEALRRAADDLDRTDYARLFHMRPYADIVVVRPDICGVVYDDEPIDQTS